MSDGITEAFRLLAESKAGDLEDFERHIKDTFIAAQRAFGEGWKARIFGMLRAADDPFNPPREFNEEE